MIKIIYEDNHLLVVQKPINILVQADNTNDLDLLTMLKQYLKEKYNKSGNVYLGLVHRLDRPVGGVMVFAKTSKSAARLNEQIRTHQFNKIYYAIVNGNFDGSKGTMEDKLLKNSNTNISTISEYGKESKLEYEVISNIEGLTLVKINLLTGRSHQIRVQFSVRNTPLYGDQKYNKKAKTGEQLALFAYSVSIIHPVTKEKMTFCCELPTYYPWKLFNII
ncbi:MAG: RluA family pseudouridine synthase [Bacilli bacterium]